MPRLEPVTMATLSVSARSMGRKSFRSSPGEVVEPPVKRLKADLERVFLDELSFEREQMREDEGERRAFDRRALRKWAGSTLVVGGDELGLAPAQDWRKPYLSRRAVDFQHRVRSLALLGTHSGGLWAKQASTEVRRLLFAKADMSAEDSLREMRRYTYAEGTSDALFDEDALVRPLNADRAHLARYRKVFTWNEQQIDGQHFLRLDYPNDLGLRELPGWHQRPLFCVLIASNKALRNPDPRALHSKRVEVIRHFEAQAPELFSLYGHGWDIAPVQPGALGRIEKRLNEWRRAWRPDEKPYNYPAQLGQFRNLTHNYSLTLLK